ncbi:MAG TPA: DUF72 domain-containing protein [Solirubrobacterales bacterium]|nr:DUF72 domain-containing protein [Solirubrobacterales bacterium]
MRPVRVGCSGWSYASWRGGFYPQGLPPARWLEHYAQTFDTVEVNATFYRLPAPSMVAGWAEHSPPGFLFAVKASRYLTHIRRLRDLGQGVERFYERLEPLVKSGKLGPVLWQLPANFRHDEDVLGAALAALPAGRHAFEFRHESWFRPSVVRLLEAHGAALVVADDARRELPRLTTSGWTYVRLHYGRHGRRGNYSDAELEEWRRRIAAWRARRDAYVYFNNDWEGFAPRNAARLRAGLH